MAAGMCAYTLTTLVFDIFNSDLSQEYELIYLVLKYGDYFAKLVAEI